MFLWPEICYRNSILIYINNPMVNCFEGFTYLFLEGEGRGERGRETLMCERNIDWSPLMCTLTGDRRTTQTCTLSGNWTGNLWLCGKTSNQLSHTSQDIENLLCARARVCVCVCSGGSEGVTPRCASVVYRLFWAKDNFSPGLKGHFSSFKCLELELGALPIIDH